METIISNNIMKVDKNVRNSETIIMSDEIGKDLGLKLTRNINSNIKITNYCKPGACAEKVLENIEDKTKHLKQGDTLILLISSYMNRYSYHSKYIQIIGKIISSPQRKYNIIISGFLYNGSNNTYMYNLNTKLFQIVKLND